MERFFCRWVYFWILDTWLTRWWVSDFLGKQLNRLYQTLTLTKANVTIVDDLNILTDALQESGISVWVDVSGLQAGVDFLSKIGEAIIDCKVSDGSRVCLTYLSFI